MSPLVLARGRWSPHDSPHFGSSARLGVGLGTKLTELACLAVAMQLERQGSVLLKQGRAVTQGARACRSEGVDVDIKGAPAENSSDWTTRGTHPCPGASGCMHFESRRLCKEALGTLGWLGR